MNICRQIAVFAAFACLGSLGGCELFDPPAKSPSPPPPPSAEPPPGEMPLPPRPSAEPPPAEAPAPTSAGIESDCGQTRGRLPKAAINEGVSQGTPAFEACYAKGAQKSPGLRGRILVNFVIAPDGSVPYAASLEQGTDFPDTAVIDCVLHVFQTLHFREPAGGRVVATYPLVLEPAPENSKPE
ncbi:MAG: AgmX/PglI C-terminal domain-containing protein [Polyangiaceae bacterium]